MSSNNALEELMVSEWVAGAGPQPSSPVQRVAIFTEAFLPKIDGVSRTALLTIKYLQNTGREVLIFAPAPAVRSVGNAQVIAIPSVGMPGYHETRIAPPWPFILPHLGRFKPDLIHLFSPFSLGSIGMLAGSRSGVPVIANYQTDLPAYTRSYGYPWFRQPMINALHFLHNGCTLNLIPSQASLAELRGWGFHRLRLWGRGVDSTRFHPDRRSADWHERLLAGRNRTRLLALYVGRMAKDKHIGALHSLAREPGIALTLVGSGSHQPELERLFSDTDARFLGPLVGDDLTAAYASADVFVFPGPEETFGQVVLEAMTSGVPPIVTDRGGPQNLIREGKNGYMVPVDDEAAFVARARLLRDHPLLRASMRLEARTDAEQWPWIAVMRQLEQYYEEAVRLHRRRTAIQRGMAK